MLAALKKCEETANVEPPNSEILFLPSLTATAITSNYDEKSTCIQEAQSTLPNEGKPISVTNGALLKEATATAISSMPTLSGLPRLSIDIDQQLSNDHLAIVKKKLELQTLHRRLSYLADYYYRELLGTISWAKELPGNIESNTP